MNRGEHPDGFAWRSWREQISQDVRYALHSWSRNRVGTAVVLLTLALGIGGTSAIFSVVNGVLLRPLPYENPDRLVRLVENIADDAPQGLQVRRAPALDLSDLETFRQRVRLLSDVGVYAPTAMTWDGEGEAWRLPAARVSSSIFEMLGARPLVGRLFEEHDSVAGAGSVLILSHQAWQQHVQRDPNIIGRTVTLDGRAFTVIGVMPEGFLFPDPHTLIWVPLLRTGAGRLPVIARVADGTTHEAAAEEFVRVMRALQGETEPTPGRAPAGVPQFELVGVQEALVAPVRPALTILSVAVAFVLAICCVNVVSLLLARALVRRPEMAVRRALGATGARIFGQVITECMVLALVAGVAGVVLALFGVEALRELGTGLIRRDLGPSLSIPRLDEVRMDGAVLFVTFAVSLGAGFLCGIAPAFWHARTDAMAGLRDAREAAARGGAHWRRHSIHGPLVVAQITLAMMLLIGAALQIHSFVKLSSVKPGYDPSNVLTFQITRPGGAARSMLGEEVISRVRLLPGVQDAGYADALPMVQDILHRGHVLSPCAHAERALDAGSSSQPRPTLRSLRLSASSA